MPAMTILPDIYQGEGKWFKFAYTRDGVVLNLTGKTAADFAFTIRVAVDDAEPIFEAESANFDIAQLALGIVRVNLPATQTILMEPASYLGQMKAILTTDTDVDKSQFVKFKILPAVVKETD